MILDPINSITSFDFYRKVSGQSLWRTFLYICYIVAVFALLSTIAFKIKAGPVLNETFDWLERSFPTLSYSDGRLSSSLLEPQRLQHPRIPEASLVIDTLRTEPVTAQVMQENRVMAYLASNAFYVKDPNGRIEVYDFSRAPGGAQTLTIDSAFFRNARNAVMSVIYPVAMASTFTIMLGWKALTTLAVYTIIALIINASVRAGLRYSSLLNIAVYAQTLMLAVVALSLFLPFRIPGLSLASVAVTAGYIWVAVKRHVEPAPLPA